MVDLKNKDFYSCRISSGELVCFNRPLSHLEAINLALGVVFQREAIGMVVFNSYGKLVGAHFNLKYSFSFTVH